MSATSAALRHHPPAGPPLTASAEEPGFMGKGPPPIAPAASGSGSGKLVSPWTFAAALALVLLLTWTAQPRGLDALGVGLRQAHLKADADVEASRKDDKWARAVRLDFSRALGVDPRQDHRGWMIDPIAAATAANLTGGTTSCLVSHLGEILPGKTRGNHRHHLYNETMVLWGAKMMLRNENPAAPEGYGQVILGHRDVAVVAGPQMQAHAIRNIDPHQRIAYLVACQDGVHDPADPHTDYKVWPDLV